MIAVVALLAWVAACVVSHRAGPIVLGAWAVPRGVRGHAWVWPFVAVADRADARLLDHEAIHHRQQCELLVVGFYVAYPIAWLWTAARHGAAVAHRQSAFEAAAYRGDRRLYGWARPLAVSP